MTKNNKSNTWLIQESEQVDVYLNTADVILIERNRTIKILIDLFQYHFKGHKNLRLLDLGCGNGILTKHICDRYPDNTFCLIDGAKDMISAAKKELSGDNISFLQLTFEDYIDTKAQKEKYDFIYSANAIHHLDLNGKKMLFTKLYQEMRIGGLFLNIDPVQPSSEVSEQWQFRMWTEWMNETLYKNNFKDDIGKYDNLPIIYKTKEENKPSTLFEQLDILAKIGFKNVDCFYKYGIFALFGGTK
ncbi:MAG: class I SAM-dependent methyltransferase [Candidatus Hodarchaeota archaeon]